MQHNILENIKMLKNILENTKPATQYTGDHNTCKATCSSCLTYTVAVYEVLSSR
jgi:hypothetical protein